jgi:hypothetical protein
MLYQINKSASLAVMEISWYTRGMQFLKDMTSISINIFVTVKQNESLYVI